MADDELTARGNGDASGRIAFDYIKGQHFRVIRADGAIGGVTPCGFIHMAFFSERPAIPRRLVYLATDEGTLGEELPGEKVSRDAIVRELDVDLFVNLQTAISLREWLDRRIAELKNRTAPTQAKKQEGK